MNAYSLGLTGSTILMLVLILASAGLAVYMYRYTLPPVSRGKKILLASLRSLSLAMLMFLLFEPVFTRTSGKVAKPKIALFVDNSQSMGIKDASVDRRSELRKVLEKSGILSKSSLLSGTYLFDNDIFEVIDFNADSVRFNGMMTDLSKPIRRLLPDGEDNIRAGILISDGVFNTGNNPLYDVGVLNKPLYVVGIGDSTESQDVSVQSLITNEIAYVEDHVPVTVNLKTSGFTSGSIDVKLYEDGKEVETKQVSISEAGQTFSLNYVYNPKREGDRKLTAKASILDGEITSKNNSTSEYIKILKNKRKYVIFSGASQSDVSFIKNILALDKNVEVRTFIQKKGAEFYGEAPNPPALHEAEMFFLIGFPNAYTSDATIAIVKNELAAGKPVFFLSGVGLSAKKLAPLEEYLPFKTVSVSENSDYIASAYFLDAAEGNALLHTTNGETNLQGWNALPPLFCTEHYVKAKPESERLANMKDGTFIINEPMILSRVSGDQKSIAVLAGGLYRWKLMTYAEEVARDEKTPTDYLTTFIQNSIRWLVAGRTNKTVTVKTTKRNFISGEAIGFTAQVYDASYNPVDNAEVTVEFSTSGQSKRSVILTSIGNGCYYADVEGVSEGDYFFNANVTVDGRNLGKDNGRFSVGEILPEFINLTMNVALLRQMAEESGGKFYTSKNCSSIMRDIQKDKNFRDRSVTVREELELWHNLVLLIVVILLLATEWVIRKREGMI